MMTPRRGAVSRKTKETEITLSIQLDGHGTAQIETGIPFFNHMLTLFSSHGLFDLAVQAKGDIDVDYHHSVEDIGICLGQAFREALGEGVGIRRYASGLIPMDEALCQMAIDISGRPYFKFDYAFQREKTGSFDLDLIKEFFGAFVHYARIALHIDVLSGENAHHIAESCFKAFGVILDQATMIDSRRADVPSTKGVL